MSKEKIILFSILALAFLARVAGIGYGLPLFLHDDEPPFVLAALKMLELRTVFPVLHSAEFKPILFYLPYASYLYLPFFLAYMAVASVYAVFAHGVAIAGLSNYFASDLSPFFLIARFISVLAGVLTVYCIYRAGKHLFNERAGLIAATLLSTSLLHITMSMSARHWVWLGLVVAAVLSVLTHPAWGFRRRYLLAVFICGIGIGFNIMSALAAIILPLHYFLLEKRGWRRLFGDKFLYGCVALFIALAVLPIALYPDGLGFKTDISVSGVKNFTGAMYAFYDFLWPIGVSEPVLALASFAGLVLLIFRRRRVAALLCVFMAVYVLAFYFGFYYAHRFTLGLFPVFVLLGGYGLATFYDNIFRNHQGKIASAALAMTIFTIFVIPVVATFWLDYLVLRGDSKSLAREWAEKNVLANEKIIVAAKRTRLTTIAEALAEQEKIDPASIRKTELAETSFAVNPHGYKSFYALNLDAVGNDDFYSKIGKYIKDNNYKYLLIAPSDLTALRQKDFYDATRGAELVAVFGMPQEVYSLTKAQYMGWIENLFKISEFGPPTAIYKFK